MPPRLQREPSDRCTPMWHYRAPAHTLLISRCGTGHYQLYANRKLLGTYPDPIDAADSLARAQTGVACLDESLQIDAPQDLGDWTPGPPSHQSQPNRIALT